MIRKAGFHFPDHASAAALRKHARHRQSSPATGIGSAAVSAAHQHCSDSSQENSVPHPEQATRRAVWLRLSNRFVMLINPVFISGSSPPAV
jgi:hypothetical protein